MAEDQQITSEDARPLDLKAVVSKFTMLRSRQRLIVPVRANERGPRRRRGNADEDK